MVERHDPNEEAPPRAQEIRIEDLRDGFAELTLTLPWPLAIEVLDFIPNRSDRHAKRMGERRAIETCLRSWNSVSPQGSAGGIGSSETRPRS